MRMSSATAQHVDQPVAQRGVVHIALGVGLKLSTPGVPRTVYAGTRYAVAGHVGPVGATFITKCRMSASSFV